jgi:AcrR family transcriptional regulator
VFRVEPVIARPTREHALAVATEMFVRGERVDTGSLADAVGVGRTTLYRWVGDRASLLSLVLAGLTDVVWERCRAEAEGEGVERAVDAVRRFMVVTSEFGPLRTFAQRESQLALRVLCTPEGLVPQRIGAGIHAAFAEALPPEEVPGPELVDVLVQVGTALEWTPVVIGQEPPIDRAVQLLRWLVTR